MNHTGSEKLFANVVFFQNNVAKFEFMRIKIGIHCRYVSACCVTKYFALCFATVFYAIVILARF